MYPLFKLIFKKANVVQTLSKYLADWSKQMGFRGQPIVIPNGVDIKKFDIELSKEERLKIRGALGLKENDIALVTTSRLVVKNGVGDVIKALPLLPKNLKFVILGEGYLKESLELEAKRLEVWDRVIWKGFVSHSDMPKYLKSCDMFIRASLSEGFGNSFIEAMAARLPVIATPVGGIPDFLVDPSKLERSERRNGMEIQTGYFCEPGNPESVASVVNRVVSDVGVNRVVDNAYKMVKEKYDWDLIAGKMKEVFNKKI
jgi:glycosyltransferase involved in cell wall biosynthesis